MTRARDLARIANSNALTIDSSGNVGIGSTVPTSKLSVVGVVSATSFFGSGVNLTGISSVSFATTSFGLSGSPNITVTGVNASGVVTATNLVVSGVTTVSAGSTAAPSISPSGDSNTGIFFPAADTIAFGEGGAESVRIDSSGRFLVGTSTARSTYFGTESPAIQVEGTSNNTSSLSITRNSNTTLARALLVLAKTRGTSVGSTTIIQNGDACGSIEFQGSDGVQFHQAASIQGEIDGTPGVSDMPGRLIFLTTPDGSATPAEQMRLDSSGNLKFNSGYGSVAIAYGCRAWVNFNGTGTVAIRASGNVSSITDNGTGDYTVNFTTALVDANYATCLTGGGDGTGYGSFPRTAEMYSAATPTTSSTCRFWTKQGSGSPGTEDSPYVNVAIFR